MIERFGVHGAAPTLLLGAVLASLPTPAPADGVNIARDAETEALIQDYARPLFKAAGISASNIQILLIPDPTFNAFVADSSHMFLNTGTLIKAKTPNEVIGVIAHETAHLAHNDLARLRQKMEDAKIGAMIAAIAGIGAAVAGATSGVNGLGQAGRRGHCRRHAGRPEERPLVPARPGSGRRPFGGRLPRTQQGNLPPGCSRC